MNRFLTSLFYEVSGQWLCCYWQQHINLLWSKYGSNVVSHTLAASSAEDCAALSLPILVGAGNAHSCRNDTVGLQHMYRFGILLKTQNKVIAVIKVC